MKNILDVNKLTKKFGDLVAVNKVSFKVQKGEIFSVVGPNGSGKTTMIKVIIGLLRATKGKIKVKGIDVNKDPIGAKSHMGYIPDEPNVWEHFTGQEFLHLVGTLFNMDEDERNQRIEELMKVYKLKGIEGGYFQNYSRGNKQKFTILGALLHNPSLLLIDEPIVGLDPKSISITKNLFVKYAKGGGSVFMATHMLPIAEEIADRIGILNRGRLVEVGTLQELRKSAGLKKNATLEKIYLKLTGEK